MAESLTCSVNYLENSNKLLRDSVKQLKKNGESNNFLAQTMLDCKRVFELVPEYDVHKAKLDLIEEVEPLVRTLEEKLDRSVVRMKRELETLQQTCELNKLRLSKSRDMDSTDLELSTDAVVITSSTNEELEQLKILKAKKLLLQEELERLQNTDFEK
ncbi:SPC19 (YDR201W) [Zygosaccharomyces parabailii]|uniref:DASH complex subunit SPC19 n=1 Tax=Zygosaccharomyces bailii (strain CLIB 213 / ATCC 58445 / CBS 680 / BCRC 21525 / NBRC 1098 / NCYC 1416 / NRRL Y-2227) TaxID=1333698 RepID=A0A8J2X5G5_ZYGB2|nr:SPC19 (YDR201W) [Zygosaccharomyces parabailii]CDF87752.1 BN860_13652g1_1 [Zygosaccharomyces bailii CLIB 213]CDH09883.1 related to DASH complex subunit SPC19 [Zygosaccharomyces bailii ISA1307]